jgi:DNA-binding GntR family transcriptional regulator
MLNGTRTWYTATVSKRLTDERGNGNAAEHSLGEQAYQVLRQAIRDGLIHTERQYSESEFAQMLGVSRTPVREALKALEREGVLEATHRRGYRLRTFSAEELEELVELRGALERIAITRLVRQASDDDLQVLADILQRQDEDRAGKNIFALDEEFHLAIAELAGLQRTRDILSGLRSAFAAVTAGADIPLEDTRRRVEEHHAIYAAIARRDTRAAPRLLVRHIDDASRELLAAVNVERATIKPLRAIAP